MRSGQNLLRSGPNGSGRTGRAERGRSNGAGHGGPERGYPLPGQAPQPRTPAWGHVTPGLCIALFATSAERWEVAASATPAGTVTGQGGVMRVPWPFLRFVLGDVRCVSCARRARRADQSAVPAVPGALIRPVGPVRFSCRSRRSCRSGGPANRACRVCLPPLWGRRVPPHPGAKVWTGATSADSAHLNGWKFSWIKQRP